MLVCMLRPCLETRLIAIVQLRFHTIRSTTGMAVSQRLQEVIIDDVNLKSLISVRLVEQFHFQLSTTSNNWTAHVVEKSTLVRRSPKLLFSFASSQRLTTLIIPFPAMWATGVAPFWVKRLMMHSWRILFCSLVSSSSLRSPELLLFCWVLVMSCPKCGGLMLLFSFLISFFFSQNLIDSNRVNFSLSGTFFSWFSCLSDFSLQWSKYDWRPNWRSPRFVPFEGENY